MLKGIGIRHRLPKDDPAAFDVRRRDGKRPTTGHDPIVGTSLFRPTFRFSGTALRDFTVHFKRVGRGVDVRIRFQKCFDVLLHV